MSCKRHNPDVLSCLANLSSDEVFTPPSLEILSKVVFRDLSISPDFSSKLPVL